MIAAVEEKVNQEGSQQEPKITESIDAISPQGISNGLVAMPIKRDQEKRRDADNLPAGKEHIENPREDHHVEAEDETEDGQEEPPVTGLTMQVVSTVADDDGKDNPGTEEIGRANSVK